MKDPTRLPNSICHDDELINQAMKEGHTILVCEGPQTLETVTALGIPAIATPSGVWSAQDFNSLRSARLSLRLCLFSKDTNWIHSTAGILLASATNYIPFVAELTESEDLVAAYGRIKSTFANLTAYDWEAEEEARLYKLLPLPFNLTRDISAIPRTDYIYGRHYIRREVSVTVAAAGMGKSFLVMTEAIAIASGRNLLGEKVTKPCSVWYWTEDHEHDAELRLRTAMEAHNVTAAEIGGRLYVTSFRDRKLKLATIEKGQVKIKRKLVEAIAAHARDDGIDVIVFDTLKKIHNVNENSNPEMDTLMDELIYIADKGQCAVELIHHMGKPGERSQNMNSSRGASSLLGAVRSGRFVCRMTLEEGEKAGVDNYKAYFSVEGGKFNKSAEDTTRRWFKLSGKDMANGENVGQLFKWDWPDAFGSMSDTDMVAILNKLSEDPMRADAQSPRWAGHIVADHLGLTIGPKPDKSDKECVQARSRVKTILNAWETNGLLKRVKLKGADRKTTPHFETTGKHRS